MRDKKPAQCCGKSVAHTKDGRSYRHKCNAPEVQERKNAPATDPLPGVPADVQSAAEVFLGVAPHPSTPPCQPVPKTPGANTVASAYDAHAFMSEEPPGPDLNVSGQPPSRYEWVGKHNRGYLTKLPETGDFRRYKNGKPKGITRATTFNKTASDQNAISEWGKRNVLMGASLRPDVVARAHGLTHENNRAELMGLVSELETAAGAKVSSGIGTLVHSLTELHDGDPSFTMEAVPAAYRDLILRYGRTLDQAGLVPVPELIERTTYIPEYGGVAGTLDRVYYHSPSGQYVIGDVKTGKTLQYGMDEIETQEWIYAHGVNRSGVYDWNTDTWQTIGEYAVRDPEERDRLIVSEDWGVVVHMPVQGPDAGKCILVEADLQRGRRHADVCHQVRVQRSNKPKPQPWTGNRLGSPGRGPESVRGTRWEQEFSSVQSRSEAASLWSRADDSGLGPKELSWLVQLAQKRLWEL